MLLRHLLFQLRAGTPAGAQELRELACGGVPVNVPPQGVGAPWVAADTAAGSTVARPEARPATPAP